MEVNTIQKKLFMFRLTFSASHVLGEYGFWSAFVEAVLHFDRHSTSLIELGHSNQGLHPK